jgi:hypothetical protein
MDNANPGLESRPHLFDHSIRKPCRIELSSTPVTQKLGHALRGEFKSLRRLKNILFLTTGKPSNLPANPFQQSAAGLKPLPTQNLREPKLSCLNDEPLREPGRKCGLSRFTLASANVD